MTSKWLAPEYVPRFDPGDLVVSEHAPQAYAMIFEVMLVNHEVWHRKVPVYRFMWFDALQDNERKLVSIPAMTADTYWLLVQEPIRKSGE